MSFFKHIPGLLLQNICRSVNLTIFKTLSNQTVFYFSPQLSSLRLFTKQWCSWSQNYKHCQTKWCQRQHSTRCLLRAHPSADTKSASTGNSELCCFYSVWVHFRNCNTKITSFLEKRAESQKDGTLWSENADGDKSWEQRGSGSLKKKKKSGLYNSTWVEICLEPLCHSPKETQGATSVPSTAALGWKSLHCPRVRFLTSHWHFHLLDKRCYRSGYMWVYWIQQLAAHDRFEAVTPDC